MTNRSFGVAGATPVAVIRELAPAAERHGYHAFWVNDTPNGDGLAALAAAAAVTSRIRLAVGVIPLDRVPAETIAQRIVDLALPQDRLAVGIGAGAMRQGGLALVREGIHLLRERTAVSVLVGALGPKMCALGGADAHGVLLNWLTPGEAARSAGEIRAAALAAENAPVHIAAYMRTAFGAAARPALIREAERYERFPQYARHFERMEVRAIETAIFGETGDDLQPRIAAFEQAVDETVVRAITAEETAAAYMALLEAAAPLA
jgi:alkanesulfonate monooxygenase SsuD/methylene tetrahydromethanopterin reductase-like flavin-dependent oxidoreductase (luciferase family)